MNNLTITQIKDLIKMTDRESVEAYINEEDNCNTTYLIISEEDAKQRV